jgi:tetratricopeptide (TPR) repeat protein
MQTVVLENERLRAVFLPELGGRLWELIDKSTGKNLLHTPSAIQIANLALRNAWFAGGIEWNIGTRGHSPTTCSPLHTGIVRSPEGQEILRMWEFDRLRQTVFQVDAWLPPDSAALLVAVRIRNPNPHEVPMYWWTNAAVPETAQSRVIAPAASAFAGNYAEGIARVVPTDNEGIDCTWPARNPHAADFFFDLSPEKRRWIINTDHDGGGLAMMSTDRLVGRKLFVWGHGQGGTRWQNWLAPEGGRYAEIQAGLAQTQFQHLAMPAGAEWSWLEAYGNAGVNAAVAHGADWNAAVEHCEARIDALLSREALDAAHAASRAWADLPPQEPVIAGTGWGALEAARRRRGRQPWVEEAGTPFAAGTITRDQQPWMDLLDGRDFLGADTFVSGEDWERLLETAAQDGQTLLHRAVMKHARGHLREARRLYLQALGQTDNAMVRRGLALAELAAGHTAEGLEHYGLACSLNPSSAPLLVEAVIAMIEADAAEGALTLIRQATIDPARLGRIRFLEALALARCGNQGLAAGILTEGLDVADLREGDNSITALWREVCPGQDVPAEYDFGMN